MQTVLNKIERALMHRLAVHLERQFPGWETDCEYDRLGDRTLRLPRGTIVSTDDHLGKSIYPDIVVHQRAIPNNLLAVEVRKSANHQPLEHDQHKLRALTDPHLWFAYWIGVLLTLGQEAGHDQLKSIPAASWHPPLVRLVCRTARAEWVCALAEDCDTEKSPMTLTRSILTLAFVVFRAAGDWVQASPCAIPRHARLEAIGEAPASSRRWRTSRPTTHGPRRAEAHHRNSGAAVQGEGPRRILPEADAGARLQGRAIDAEGNVIAVRKGSGGGGRGWWCRRISTRCFPKAPTSR